LCADNVHEVHPEFVRFGTSSMSDRLASQIYHDRHSFGGTGFYGEKHPLEFDWATWLNWVEFCP